MDPQKGETVLDPACGTAGFLISSYKHILNTNMDGQDRQDGDVNTNMDAQDGQDINGNNPVYPGESILTPEEKGRLAESFRGYDISPDMVRLSLVNMYLHGFAEPHIFEYDTLTSDDRWNEHADVILANPPFMSPKGGIRPHNRFSVQSRRSEVLFVDYMAEHLTPTGRAGIIVPEGIIFQSQRAYTQLRKKLVEEYLVAVVSLPAGVFQPYSGVKTSILLLDRALARRTDRIAFFKVENDGYDLGAQRREIDKNDLPDVARAVREYMHRDSREGGAGTNMDGQDTRDGSTGTGMDGQAAQDGGTGTDMDGQDGQDKDGKQQVQESRASYVAMVDQLVEQGAALIVEKDKIAANGDYNLSGERYRESRIGAHVFPLARIGDVCTINPRKSELADLEPDTRVSFVPMADLVEKRMTFQAKKEKCLAEVSASYTYFADDDVILARVTPCFENGKAGIARGLLNGIGFGSSEFIVLRCGQGVLPEWMYFCVTHPVFRNWAIPQMTGTGGLQRVPRASVADFQIPLPPLAVQQEIVAEIDGYQRVIEGARAVVENYRPRIVVDPEWPLVGITDVVADEPYSFKAGPFGSTLKKSCYVPFGYKVYGQEQVIRGDATFGDYYITKEKYVELQSCKVEAGDVLISLVGTYGKIMIVPDDYEPGIINPRLVKITLNRDKMIPEFLVSMFVQEAFLSQVRAMSHGGTMNILSMRILKSLRIPLPSLETQQEIVAEIEAEQALVAANRELTERFERKIEAAIGRVWGEG